MPQITGKYELVKSENWAAHLIGIGLPEDIAKRAEAGSSVYDIKQDGDNITVGEEKNDGQIAYHNVFVLNKEIDEQLPWGKPLKTKAVLDGEVLTFYSTNGTKKGRRIFKFNGNEVVVTHQDDDAKVPVATRTFKRL
ncbi:hypothetical protein HHI36_016686 [Cryptolaemus montrouzieri]|uniref:Uncharacterized protein n=1 Tax=Cryptolaemus montrouzieri TaxID=559131 RepID=A0ABD2NKE6_9CUCU